jgi:prevent-host-death family protein
MRVVGLNTLKNKLRKYIRIAERGERVLVTDHGNVIAVIVPPEMTRSRVPADALLAEAVRQGWITPPTLPSVSVPPRNPIMTFRELKLELDEDRSDR